MPFDAPVTMATLPVSFWLFVFTVLPLIGEGDSVFMSCFTIAVSPVLCQGFCFTARCH